MIPFSWKQSRGHHLKLLLRLYPAIQTSLVYWVRTVDYIIWSHSLMMLFIERLVVRWLCISTHSTQIRAWQFLEPWILWLMLRDLRRLGKVHIISSECCALMCSSCPDWLTWSWILFVEYGIKAWISQTKDFAESISDVIVLIALLIRNLL